MKKAWWFMCKVYRFVSAHCLVVICLGACFMLCSFIETASASEPTPGKKKAIDFTSYSLEDLIDYEVTSVSRKSEKLSQTPAAAFVITQEDIRRSGFTTLPDLFRMVPGMQVARSDPGDFSVSARGFMGEFANKLLVMLDGRTIYSPLFSGVFWDYNDVLLENIERIEIIRGTGATLWGANAVNGVINIITKHSSDTQGVFLTGVTGTTEERYGAVRYGGRIGDHATYQVYAKEMQFDMVDNPRQKDPEHSRVGFRFDWDASADCRFFLSGDYYSAKDSALTARPMIINNRPKTVDVKGHAKRTGFFLLGSWQQTFSSGSDMQVQMYYDRQMQHSDRYVHDKPEVDTPDEGRSKLKQDIFDVDVQHRLQPLGAHDVIWGVGFRMHKDSSDKRNIFYALDPRSRYYYLYSCFVQDAVRLISDRLTLTVGSKFEYNSYTDFEFQPSARLFWNAHENHSLWAAISRAVRTPARYEHDGNIRLAVLPRGSIFPLAPPVLTAMQGSESFDSEELLAFELGYRAVPLSTVSFDFAVFYNFYDDLKTLEPAGLVLKRSYLFFPLEMDNKMDGRSYGFEATANWHIKPWWRLQSTFTWLQINLDQDSDSRAANATKDEKMSPSTQFTIRSLLDITERLELDIGIYFMDKIPALGVGSYTNITVRLGWMPIKNLDLSLIGQNLFDSKHNEFSDEIFKRAENAVERSLFIRLSWQY